MISATLIVLTLGAAIAAFSISASLQLILMDSVPAWLGVFDFPAILLMLLPLLLACKGMRQSCTRPCTENRRLLGALVASVVLMGALNFYIFLVLTAAQPHGDWDAWAIWNLHARFIFRGGGDWHAYLTPALNWSHPDYPLMLPAAVARGWQILKGETTLVPILVAATFTALPILLVSFALRALRSKLSALLGAAVLLGTPLFAGVGSTQYADIPISYFYLASLVLLALRETSPNRGAALFASFTMAGCAAWTKNEGILFLLVAAASHLAVTARHKGLKPCLKDSFVVLAAAAPFIAMLVMFRQMTPGNDIMTSVSGSSLSERVLDIDRYGEIIITAVIKLVTFNNGLAIAAGAVLLLLGTNNIRKNPAIQTCLIIVGAMCLGFFAIFLITPHDLTWHLATALDRLMIQVWPSVIFAGLLSYDITTKAAAGQILPDGEHPSAPDRDGNMPSLP